MRGRSAERIADTRVPIHPDIAARWSPRMFDPTAEVTVDQITALLEAGRWAATWGHRQPVRFIVGMRGDETFDKTSAVLKKGNRYAGVRPVAVVAVGSLGDYTEAPPEILERDAIGRQRLPLEEIAFAGGWGKPFQP